MSRRAMTLIELLVAAWALLLLVGGAMSMFTFALRQARATTTDIDLTQSNTLGLRRMCETMRQAMSYSISPDGMRIVFVLPMYSGTVDPVTGENELVIPLTSDGQTHAYSVANGQLTDEASHRVLAKNVVTIDPDPYSSQYNQAYTPFQATTIGSKRAISVNLITRSDIVGAKRYVRMKTTVILRNGQ